MKLIEKQEFGGLVLTSCNYNEAADMFINSIDNKSKTVFIHSNYNNYYILRVKEPLDKDILKNSVIFFEGIGMKSVAFLKGWGNIPDINGTDLFPVLAHILPERNISIFLIGSEKNILEKAVSNVKTKYSLLRIAGYQDGYFDYSQENSIIDKINKSGADLLLLGMGMQKESEFINRNYNQLNVKAIWTVGGLFDFLSGAKPRAPRFIRTIRLEWLFRFMIEPSKKFRRVFVVYFWFLLNILRGK
jgi:N-acetylglucosaminyldiphosphoundecaprenol N-acetyl-beta-D-mannosaminyltransferase